MDRSKTTKNGKFRPWILRMMGPVAVASLLMYATWFRDMPMGFKIVWMFVTYILWGYVCCTGVNIPYGSMASAITSDPKQRSELSTWRTIGATLAATACGVVLPMVIYYTDTEGHTALNGSALSVAAIVCSVLAVICYILCYALTTERVKMETTTGKFNLGELGRSLVTNRSLIALAIFNLIIWAMITDVIDDTEVKTGKRSDGTIYAVYSFARKLGQAASSGLTGLLLSIIGYSAATAFDPDVVNGIYNITCIAPAIGFVLLALALIFLYPLKKSVVEENARTLAARREGK